MLVLGEEAMTRPICGEIQEKIASGAKRFACVSVCVWIYSFYRSENGGSFQHEAPKAQIGTKFQGI